MVFYRQVVEGTGIMMIATRLQRGQAFVPIFSQLRFNSPLGSASPETAEKEQQGKTFDDVHEFKLERNYYKMLGKKGTRPSQQYQQYEGHPSIVCRKCRNQLEAKILTGTPSEGETSFEWNKDEYMVPKNPVDLEARCGEVITFRVGPSCSTCSIQRSILQERHPNSMLFRLVSERWEEKAYSEIPIDGYHDYFGYVLDFVRDGTVCLPSSLLKSSFLKDLTYYEIDFDPDNVIVEMDPFLMRAILAAKERLDGFHERIIEGDLQKELDDAKLKLNAAVVAHSIMRCYTQTPTLSLRWEPTGEVRAILLESGKDEDFWKYCNGFLKDFFLRVQNMEIRRDDSVSLGLEFLSE
jgi:hypothetical protein